MKKYLILLMVLFSFNCIGQTSEFIIGFTYARGPGRIVDFNRMLKQANANTGWLTKNFDTIQSYHGWGLNTYAKEGILEAGISLNRLYSNTVSARGDDPSFQGVQDESWLIRHRVSKLIFYIGLAPVHFFSFGIGAGSLTSRFQLLIKQEDQKAKIFDWLNAQNIRKRSFTVEPYATIHLHREEGKVGLDLTPYYNFSLGTVWFGSLLDAGIFSPGNPLPDSSRFQHVGIKLTLVLANAE
jgi:hypothetical protein